MSLAAAPAVAVGAGPGAASPLSSRVAPAWQTILSEGFEGSFPGPGWTVSYEPLGYGEYYWGKRNCQAHSGSGSAWAVGAGADGAALACGNDYPQMARSSMAYGPFDLRFYTAAELSFWFRNQTAEASDYFSWSASENGTSFTGGGTHTGSTAGWQEQVFDLSQWLGKPQVWVRFYFFSDGSVQAGSGPFVDDVTLRGLLPPPGDFIKAGPSDGQNDLPTSVSLSWLGSDLWSYEYCLDTTDDDACSTSWVGVGSAMQAQVTGLQRGTTYYWQVRAVNTTGTTYADGAAGAFWSFTVPFEARLRSVGARDGWVRESASGSGVGGAVDATAATCRVGDDAADRQYRSILDFNTAGLPDGATVTWAQLKIRKSSIVGGDPLVTLMYLGADIRTGAFNQTAALEAADFQAPASGDYISTPFWTPGGRWYYAGIGATGRSLVNRGGHTQFRLRFTHATTDHDQAADYLTFSCGDALNRAYRPMLTVRYVVP